MFSNVENQNENEMTNDDAVEKLRKKQCLLFLEKLNQLFWNKKWKFKTNNGEPFLHKIRYGEERAKKVLEVVDHRFLCIFSKEEVESSDPKTLVEHPMENAYLRRLFFNGWELGEKTLISKLAQGGSHNPFSLDIYLLLKHLNLKLDGNDVVIDIGYGTGTLLYGLACMLQTKVYGSEISPEVFSNTVNSCKQNN
jgi:hypothetical protein